MGEKPIIVSNRLPYRLKPMEKGCRIERSSGGLASALGPLHESGGGVWIGAADRIEETPGAPCRTDYEHDLAERGCVPVFLGRDEEKGFYDGFSNSTIWPLFHGFSSFARFDEASWSAYAAVNIRFRDAVLSHVEEGDTIWIQDYHLMLLPAMLREVLPAARIGFFLHIPFPDYETFRMLPWRKEILEGLLGADLIGFHTYGYVRHFLSSCQRISGLDNRMGSLWTGDRLVQADVFSLGIDYDRFRDAARDERVIRLAGAAPVRKRHSEAKAMLSVERLDYSKGIPERLRAFDAFLKRYPEWRERVTLTMVAVPSRENVSSYQLLKRQVDELVGRINGEYATLSWNPVDYYHRSLPFDRLCAAYKASDVMLVTPLRDGMNLVCKEYLAVHDKADGVLILSEMAGAAGELSDAVIVNPFDRDAMVEAMHTALTMPADEQRRRNALMQNRLRRYTSAMWAREFLNALDRVKSSQSALDARLMGEDARRKLLERFFTARRRAILLDYDGTIVPFSLDPMAASPGASLLALLNDLAANEKNDVAVLSGRDRKTLQSWLGDLPVSLVAEHGAWTRERGGEGWVRRSPLDDSWKHRMRPVLEGYVDRTPGAFLEEKDNSLVWHYRACNVELAERRVAELRAEVAEIVEELGLQLMSGKKVIEVRMAGVDKGSAAYGWFGDRSFDFILVAGDDSTDEDMFAAAPSRAWTLKVGAGPTRARYTLKSRAGLLALLRAMADGDRVRTGSPGED